MVKTKQTTAPWCHASFGARLAVAQTVVKRVMLIVRVLYKHSTSSANRCDAITRIFIMEAAMKEHMFWGLVASLAIYFFFTYQRLERIAADIKVIRATCTQQAKECHNLDTTEVKNK